MGVKPRFIALSNEVKPVILSEAKYAVAGKCRIQQKVRDCNGKLQKSRKNM